MKLRQTLTEDFDDHPIYRYISLKRDASETKHKLFHVSYL